MIHINPMAVVVAALSNFLIGFLMHGPVGGKFWMKLANIHPTGNEKFSDMVPQMVKNFIVHIIFVTAFAGIYSIAISSPILNGGSLIHGVELSLVVWAGFICTTTSIEVIWMGRSAKLWLYECFCSLLVCAAMGAIVAVMQ